MCDEYSAEVAAAEKRADEAERLRILWFNENSAAQAALGRVRDLVDRLTANGPTAPPLTQPLAAQLIREAMNADDLVTEQVPPPTSCTACDYGYPASACSPGCDCGAC